MLLFCLELGNAILTKSLDIIEGFGIPEKSSECASYTTWLHT